MVSEIFDQEPSESAGRLRIIFLHHSVGRRLIREGAVRALIAERNRRDGTAHELWDHDYNEIGLAGPSGEKMGISFDVPGDNTDPDGLDALFSQPEHHPPDNALSRLLSFDVVIFKPCFPASAIGSSSQLEQHRRHYLSIRETMARYSQHFFIVMTPPPLVPKPMIPSVITGPSDWTTAEDAARARSFSRWLASEQFSAGLSNVAVLDLFDLLAEPQDSRRHPNMLRAAYRSGRFGQDAHPNAEANRAIAPLFVGRVWDCLSRLQQTRRASAGVL